MRLLQKNGVCCHSFGHAKLTFFLDFANTSFSYNQRKRIEKHQFPLDIGTFCRYNQRKHIKKHQFPLIIEN